MAKGGLRVCEEVASDIKTVVKFNLVVSGHLSHERARTLRAFAKVDHDIH